MCSSTNPTNNSVNATSATVKGNNTNNTKAPFKAPFVVRFYATPEPRMTRNGKEVTFEEALGKGLKSIRILVLKADYEAFKGFAGPYWGNREAGLFFDMRVLRETEPKTTVAGGAVPLAVLEPGVKSKAVLRVGGKSTNFQIFTSAITKLQSYGSTHKLVIRVAEAKVAGTRKMMTALKNMSENWFRVEVEAISQEVK